MTGSSDHLNAEGGYKYSAPTTVLDPRVGDKMTCPGCGDLVTLTAQDGWCGPHTSCHHGTVHSDWIITKFSNPNQQNPLPTFDYDAYADSIYELNKQTLDPYGG